MWVRSSACQPVMPWAPACRNDAAMYSASSPVSAARSTGGARLPSAVGHLLGGHRQVRFAVLEPGTASRASAPAKAAVYSARSPRPCRRGGHRRTRRGARSPTPQAAARHRSGSTAAQASARGPPPDQPRVTNSPRPRWSSTTAVSRASSATVAVVVPSARGVDAPYPGREAATTRSPRRSPLAPGSRTRPRPAACRGGRPAADRLGSDDPDLDGAAVRGGYVLGHRRLLAGRTNAPATLGHAASRRGRHPRRLATWPERSRSSRTRPPARAGGPGPPRSRCPGSRRPASTSAASSAGTRTRPVTWPAAASSRASRASWWWAATAWCTWPCRSSPAPRPRSGSSPPAPATTWPATSTSHGPTRSAPPTSWWAPGPGASTWPAPARSTT